MFEHDRRKPIITCTVSTFAGWTRRTSRALRAPVLRRVMCGAGGGESTYSTQLLKCLVSRHSIVSTPDHHDDYTGLNPRPLHNMILVFIPECSTLNPRPIKSQSQMVLFLIPDQSSLDHRRFSSWSQTNHVLITDGSLLDPRPIKSWSQMVLVLIPDQSSLDHNRFYSWSQTNQVSITEGSILDPRPFKPWS